MTVAARVAEGDHAYSWALTVHPQDIEQCRREVAATVGELGGDSEAVGVARLGVSELVSNACKHVDDPRCELVVSRDGPCLRVQLSDRSRQVPAVSVADWHSESGRGLWLLREMTETLGYTCVPGGKAVWFTIRLCQSAPAAAATAGRS